MNALQLKNQIIDLVSQVDNVSLLEMIKGVLTSNAEDVYELNEFEANMLEESAADYEKGNFKTHEQVQKEIKEWLKNK